MNKERAYETLIKTIKEKFGPNPTIIMGDWSDRSNNNSPIKYISTPGIGLKRKLATEMTIYNIDEFRTSKLHHKTEEICNKIRLPDKKGEMRKMHSILTYTTKSKRMGCIDRDNNAVNNMIKLTKKYIQDGTRPMRYRRGVKLEEGSNPINSVIHKKIFQREQRTI